MTTTDFREMLRERMERKHAHLCIGLDPKPSDGWDPYEPDFDEMLSWYKRLVDTTAPYAAAYKPNLQYYLRWGSRGIKVLEDLNQWMRQCHGEIPRILDAKWGDIGESNLPDVAFANSLGVKAVTIGNYMGVEAMVPLLGEFCCFVLCKTSNSGSGEFQDLELRSGEKWRTVHLYDTVAKHVEISWNGIGPGAGLVVGATHPVQLAAIDQEVKGLVFLIPGVGKQGGTVREVMRAVRNNTPLINVSSGVTSANDPAEAARMFNKQIEEALSA